MHLSKDSLTHYGSANLITIHKPISLSINHQVLRPKISDTPLLDTTDARENQASSRLINKSLGFEIELRQAHYLTKVMLYYTLL